MSARRLPGARAGTSRPEPHGAVPGAPHCSIASGGRGNGPAAGFGGSLRCRLQGSGVGARAGGGATQPKPLGACETRSGPGGLPAETRSSRRGGSGRRGSEGTCGPATWAGRAPVSDCTLSVIIPTRHRPDLLRQALTCVEAQTRCPDEVLVIDDGDAPQPVIPGAGVRWVRHEAPHGAARARNLGALLAQGRFLAFLDDDDTWDPAYLAEAEHLVLTERLELVLTAFLKVRHQEGAQEVVPEKVPPAYLHPDDFLVRNPGLRGSNLFISRATFLQSGGFDPALPSFHDMDLGIRLAALPGLRYGRNTRPRVHFHVHPELRLSTAGSPTNVAGIRAFLAKHAGIMGPERVSAFRERARRLFGVDP
ncbi:MAG: glycosyltransferase family 2 protein [Myxococcaceae bacterium]|nr:MAG: glycosyltransferase family 2 protein [Myxococcaceae bacterium]